MSGLSKTGTVLVAVFAFCLIAFATQLAYVLWWRRRFRRRSTAALELDVFSSGGGDTAATPPPPSKELLYFFFFCLENKQFGIEPATAPPLPSPLDDVALKWPPSSRALFTIAEEREGPAADGATDSFNPTAEIEGSKIVSLEDQFDESDENDVVDSGSDHYDDATPFSTPCASPPYYTPSPSPVRDDVSMTSV